VRDGLVRRNAAALVDRPIVAYREAAYLSPAQAQALLEATREHRLYALYAVAIAAGLRRGEALALHWSDVNLEAGTIRVSWTLSRTSAGLIFTEPKARSRRTVPLPDALLDELRAHRTRQLAERLAAGSIWTDHDLVFPSLTGSPLDPRNALRAFLAAAARAGLPGVGLHPETHLRQPAAGPRRPPAGGHGDPWPLRLRDHDGHLQPRHAEAAAGGRGQDAGRPAVANLTPVATCVATFSPGQHCRGAA